MLPVDIRPEQFRRVLGYGKAPGIGKLSNTRRSSGPEALAASVGAKSSGARTGSAREALAFLLNIGISMAWPDSSIPLAIRRGARSMTSPARPRRAGASACAIGRPHGSRPIVPGAQPCYWQQRIVALRFPQVNQVDTTYCFAYTCAVVLRPTGLVVKGKSSSPGTENEGTGSGRAAGMGRQPRTAAGASPQYADAVHSTG